jgi:glycosyltransferase involved in cell wall biosynthesis
LFYNFFIKVYKNIFWYPDPYSNVIKDTIKRGKIVIKKNKFDAVLSSAHPVTSHIIASSLAKEAKIPWIADFRDLWTQNHYNLNFWIRTIIERRLEIKTMKNADALVTVSGPLSNKLSEIHQNKPVFTILNGFDPNQINNGIQISKQFTITYTGNLYGGRRDPKMLFKEIRKLINENSISSQSLMINFFGLPEDFLFEEIIKFGLEKNVCVHGRVPREIAIKKQQESQILLLLTWNNPEEIGVYTSKVFEYFASLRPILSMGYPEGGILKSLLDQTQTGTHITNEEDLKKYLLEAYHEYKINGSVRYRGINDEIMKYSNLEMAKNFAELLNRFSNK